MLLTSCYLLLTVYCLLLTTEVFHFLAVAEMELDTGNVDQLQQCLVTLVEFVQGNLSQGNSRTLLNGKCIELLGRLMSADVLDSLEYAQQDQVHCMKKVCR